MSDKLDIALFKKALALTEEQITSLRFKVTDKSMEFFKEIPLPVELIEFLQNFSFRYPIKFGQLLFNNVNLMRTENLNSLNKSIYKKDWFIIGSGLNGDPIVVNTKTLEIGFAFHDELWEKESPDLDKVIVNSHLSLGSFFHDAFTKESFPIDAYDAKEYFS